MATDLEVKGEKKFVNWALYHFNIVVLKMEVRGRRNWPDRQVLMGHGYTFFIEFKRPGGPPPRPAQLHRHKKLRERGYNVYVCYTFEEAKEILLNEILEL